MSDSGGTPQRIGSVAGLQPRLCRASATATLAGLAALAGLALVPAGCSPGGAETRRYAARADEPPAPLEVVSSDGLCRLMLPGHWRVFDHLHDQATLQVGNLRREEYLIMLTDYRDDFGGTLEEHVALTSSGIVGLLEGARISDSESLTINGMPALRHEISGTKDRMKLVYIQTTIEGAHGFHQMLAWTLASRADHAREVLLGVTASFRELDPPPSSRNQT